MRSPVRAYPWARPLSAARDAEHVWLFDLDNTLHNASQGIFQAIDTRMTSTVADLLQVDQQHADALRTQYWERYGATMIGLHKHHQTDPHLFLHLTHNFDVQALVQSEKCLAGLIKGLPGYKLLLTNAPLDYAQRVMRAIHALPAFDGIWSIEHMRLQGRYRPKPSRALMQQVVARLQTPPERITLVEDTLRNLKSARQCGINTIHIFNPGTPFSALHRGRSLYVDSRINRLRQIGATQMHSNSDLVGQS